AGHVTGVQTCALPICCRPSRARCSSASLDESGFDQLGEALEARAERLLEPSLVLDRRLFEPHLFELQRALAAIEPRLDPRDQARSEERRVGKEGKSRW